MINPTQSSPLDPLTGPQPGPGLTADGMAELFASLLTSVSDHSETGKATPMQGYENLADEAFARPLAVSASSTRSPEDGPALSVGADPDTLQFVSRATGVAGSEGRSGPSAAVQEIALQPDPLVRAAALGPQTLMAPEQLGTTEPPLDQKDLASTDDVGAIRVEPPHPEIDVTGAYPPTTTRSRQAAQSDKSAVEKTAAASRASKSNTSGGLSQLWANLKSRLPTREIKLEKSLMNNSEISQYPSSQSQLDVTTAISKAARSGDELAAERLSSAMPIQSTLPVGSTPGGEITIPIASINTHTNSNETTVSSEESALIVSNSNAAMDHVEEKSTARHGATGGDVSCPASQASLQDVPGIPVVADLGPMQIASVMASANNLVQSNSTSNNVPAGVNVSNEKASGAVQSAALGRAPKKAVGETASTATDALSSHAPILVALAVPAPGLPAAPARIDNPAIVSDLAGQIAGATFARHDHQIDLSARMEAIADEVFVHGRTGHEAKFRIEAAELGRVGVELSRQTDGISVRFEAGNDSARVALTDAQPRFAADARAAGLTLNQSRVDTGGSRERRGARPDPRHPIATAASTASTNSNIPSVSDRFA